MLHNIHIKYYYTAGAILMVCLCLLVSHPIIWLGCAWLALSLILVSSAYWFNIASIFRKRRNGTIPWYIRWGFVPFLLACRYFNGRARKRDKVPPMQKIDNQLFLACRLFTTDIKDLRENNISAVLDVTAEFDALDWSLLDEDMDYLNVPILDHSVPTPAQLNQAINWIHRQVKAGKSVVIHCALGRGRSVLVLAAYLVCRNPEFTFSQVLDEIRQIRQTAGLNKWQLKTVNRMYEQGKISIHKQAWLIANPVSGAGKWQQNAKQIQQELADYFDVQLALTADDISAKTLATQAKDAGADIIIACGGDGTVTEVASVITDTNILLGIIPLGTTNALAHVLFGIGSKIIPIRQALDIIIQGHSTKVDTAKCNNDLVLLLVGVGFEQQMIENANRERKNALGQLAYLDGLWRAISTSEVLHINLQLDDEQPVQLQTHSLVVANAAPFTSVLAQGNGEPDMTDGLLDITWLDVGDEPEDQLLSLTELMLTRFTPPKVESKIHHAQAKKVRLSGQANIKYVIDGEVFEADELNIDIHPASLRVLVPAITD